MPLVRSRRKAGAAELTLDGLHLLVSKSEILDVPERLAVLRPANIFYKRLVAVSEHALQVKSLDKSTLCVPALRLESALTNVVVRGRARKSEVVGQQRVYNPPVLRLP